MTTPIVPSITDDQISEIEHLAGKATPGDWWIDSHGHSMVSHDDGTTHTVFQAMPLVKPAARHPETGNLSHWPNDWDASYIATACPQNIQGLISRLRAAEKDAARYRWLREFIDQSPQAIEHLPCSDGDLIDEVIDAAMEKQT